MWKDGVGGNLWDGFGGTQEQSWRKTVDMITYANALLKRQREDVLKFPKQKQDLLCRQTQ